MSGADDRIEAKAILGIPAKPDPGVVDLGWGRRARIAIRPFGPCPRDRGPGRGSEPEDPDGYPSRPDHSGTCAPLNRTEIGSHPLPAGIVHPSADNGSSLNTGWFGAISSQSATAASGATRKAQRVLGSIAT